VRNADWRLHSPAASATGPTNYFLQYNLCGSVCNGGGTDSTVDLANRIATLYWASTTAIGVSMQEACMGTLTSTGNSATYSWPNSPLGQLAALYQPYGYQVWNYGAKYSTNPSSNCGYNGPAVLAWGTGGNTVTGGLYTVQDGLENRAFVCEWLPVSTAQTKACSTHLSLNGEHTDQLHEYDAIDRYWWVSDPTISNYLGGDFNIEYCEVVGGFPVDPYNCPYGGPATSPSPHVDRLEAGGVGGPLYYTIDNQGTLNRTIDFALVDYANYSGRALQMYYPTHSDHTLVQGMFVHR
jgi:hypothetical protein